MNPIGYQLHLLYLYLTLSLIKTQVYGNLPSPPFSMKF